MIRIYDQDMNMLAILDYADVVSYSLPHNDLWTASFKLPTGDQKNVYCQMHNLVSIDDGPRNIGLYRIISVPNDDVTDRGGYVEYSCEHVAATLLDDILFGYHEIGGGSVRTEDVIRYILARQEVIRWQLGTCEFSNRFAYKFENATLLGALLSLGEVLTEPYTWDFDTTTTPWTVNLRKADTEAGCGIYYQRNLRQIKRTVDATTLVTRLYLLGYGEGINQLTIKDINNGLPYLDADTIGTYGIKKSVFCDRRFENAEALKARGEALLASLKIPYYTYTAKAVDLVQLTGDPWDEFMPGKVVHVMDGADRVEFVARIVCVAKPDVNGRKGEIEITIANSVRDIADSINTLADRQGINELYSQGATNLYAQQYADNADAEHPARMRVYIPNGCVRINQMLLSFDVDAFRAYETGASSGGGTTVTSEGGGGTTVTSEGGGSMTITSEGGGGMTVTSEGGGGVTVTSEDGGSMTVTSEGGGATTATSSSGGGSEKTSSSGGGTTSTTSEYIDSFALMTEGMYEASEGYDMTDSKLSSDSVETSEAGSHTHTGPSHAHGLADHKHYLGSHSHSFSGSTSLAWGHMHTTSTSFEPGNNTGGVANYAAKTIEISGTTGTLGKYTEGSSAQSDLAGTGNTGSAGAHSHTVKPHSHNIRHFHWVNGNIKVPAQTITIPSHRHTVTIDDHTHDVTLHDHTHDVTIDPHAHDVTIDDHSHDVTLDDHTHDVTIDDHTHDVTIDDHTHDVTIEDHTHEIIHGIFEGGTASSIRIVVDGTQVPDFAAASVDELDIVEWLEKDEEGRITRGTWHTVELVPDKLTRIEANLFVQTFVQSIGGGDY